MRYYAHTIDGVGEDEWHPLKDHLQDTATRAAEFALSFHADEFGRVAGLLHDIGKYSQDFQRRLRGEPVRVDHSTAGAQEAVRLYKNSAIGFILAYVIAGHHSGLPDYGSSVDDASLKSRLNKAVPDYQSYLKELEGLPSLSSLSYFPFQPNPKSPGFTVQFFIRMLFACLVDADFLDTEYAINPQQSQRRGQYVDLATLQSRLAVFFRNRYDEADETPINRLRSQILDRCRESSTLPRGFFSLTVPTGGGKTLSSMSFALRHALTHGFERVVYVIPFTSIIEQNAAVFRDALGACVSKPS